MRCPNCGEQVENNSKFCQFCGERFSRSKKSEWYYVENGVRKGPINEDDILDSIDSGTITFNTLVWEKGMKEWAKLKDTRLAEYSYVVVPEVPLEEISDKWLWTLATLPLVAGWILTGIVGSEAALICTIILNCIFTILDMKEVENSGQKVSSWLWMGIILVPLYMYVRIAKTTKRYAPAIVYTVLFFINLFV